MISRHMTMSKEMNAFLSLFPITNMMVLCLNKSPGKRFYADDTALEKGVLGISPRMPNGIATANFSYGDSEFETGLIDHVPSGSYLWEIPNTNPGLREALEKRINFSSMSMYVTYSRVKKGPVAAGSARLLTTEDLSALPAERCVSAQILAAGGESKVFGVIEDGQWVADAWITRMFDRYWSICDLFVKPERRGRGFGQAVTGACLNYLLQEEQVPVYEADSRNRPALRLAEKLGMRYETSRVVADGVLPYPRQGPNRG